MLGMNPRSSVSCKACSLHCQCHAPSSSARASEWAYRATKELITGVIKTKPTTTGNTHMTWHVIIIIIKERNYTGQSCKVPWGMAVYRIKDTQTRTHANKHRMYMRWKLCSQKLLPCRTVHLKNSNPACKCSCPHHRSSHKTDLTGKSHVLTAH